LTHDFQDMAYETSKIGTLLKITLMSNFEFFSLIWKLSTGTTGEKVKFSYEKSSVTITSEKKKKNLKKKYFFINIAKMSLSHQKQ
jgi:hypothetical protein